MATEEKDPGMVILHANQVIGGSNNTGYYYDHGQDGNGNPAWKREEDMSVAPSPRTGMTQEERELATYIQDPARRAEVIEMLRQVTTARELAYQVVARLHDEPLLFREVIVKRAFIEALLHFSTQIVHGKSVDNVRDQINMMLTEQRKNWKRRTL